MSNLKETVLDDNFPVYPSYFYVADDKVIECMIAGNVAGLRHDLESHGVSAKIIKTCDLMGRFKFDSNKEPNAKRSDPEPAVLTPVYDDVILTSDFDCKMVLRIFNNEEKGYFGRIFYHNHLYPEYLEFHKSSWLKDTVWYADRDTVIIKATNIIKTCKGENHKKH